MAGPAPPIALACAPRTYPPRTRHGTRRSLEVWAKPYRRTGASGPYRHGSGTGRTGVANLLDRAHRIAKLPEPLVGVLPDEANTPGQRVATASRHPCVDQGVENKAVALTEPGHHGN